ncbi:MAG TPA: hypothetical protein VME42_01735 [Steroidobacteraceae bacterium]|nr:hypothetical protein [Steroidobacteraceae bacterium]
MAYGDCRDDEALRAAWQGFCDRLKEAGERVFKDYNPPTPQHRADAFRFLTQNLGQAFDLALETRDTRFPVVHAFCTPFCKLGGDCADFVYQQAWIDGESVYKISGNRGTARFLNFTVQGPRPEKQPGTDWPSLHEPFGDIPEANLFGHQLETQWDGSFELYVGGPRRGPNWLPTTPGSRKLFMRQGFDRWNELPARFRIERVGMEQPRPVASPELIIQAADWAGRFVTGLMNDWPDHPYHYSGGSVDSVNVNAFPAQAKGDGAADQRRGRAAVNMCWQLASDEALIVEFDSHDGFWMLTNMGVFFNSMDYLYRPVSYTPSRTKVDADGKVRLILCRDDPGYHNWMDTQGFERGNVTYRNLMSEAKTVFRTERVKRAQLAAALPAQTARVSAEDRLRQMHERFDGIRLRYGL